VHSIADITRQRTLLSIDENQLILYIYCLNILKNLNIYISMTIKVIWPNISPKM
jgi:hypothetical protein